MVYLLIYILWVMYMSLEGYTEAIYFHFCYNSSSYDYTNEHEIWTIQRIVVGLAFMLAIIFFDYELLLCLEMFAAIVLSAPFFHDGFYYFKRNQLNNFIYKRKFFDQTTTPRSIITILSTPVLRTAYFVVSVLVLITILIS